MIIPAFSVTLLSETQSIRAFIIRMNLFTKKIYLMMCTRPIEIKRTLPTGQVKSYLVPCGKCEECRASYQSEFACRVALEASAKGSLHFFTLTYNNDWLPVNYCEVTKDGLLPTSFGRGRFCAGDSVLDTWSRYGCKVVESPEEGLLVPTLYRKDVQAWLRKFRKYCDRHDLPKDFAFSCFGEYGEQKARPHYHALFAGLTEEQARILSNMWTYGFCEVKSIPRFNKDGSDAYVLTSDYVSKYIAKRDKLPSFVRDGLAESPRRQSSIGLGLTDLDFDSLRPFLFSGGLQASSARFTFKRD